jgi:hypothetical protein
MTSFIIHLTTAHAAFAMTKYERIKIKSAP